MRLPIAPIDLVETIAISLILSGVLWNVLAGYRIVSGDSLPVAITLTTLLVTAVFLFEHVNRPNRSLKP